MDQRWFMTFGVLLICAIYMLIGTEQQQSLFGLWLDRHSSQEVAEANALRPLIRCVNLADVPWRLDRAAPPSKQRDDFPYIQRYDPDAILRDFCKPDIVFKSGIVEGTRQIGPIVGHYTSTFRAMLERYQGLQRDSSPDATLALTRHDKDYAYRIEAFLSASEAMRRELESLELTLRPKQLELLEQSQGRDLHWYLLNYMIRARETADQLTEAANRQKLDLPLLAAISEALLQARQAGETYRDSHPATHRKGPVQDLWSLLEEPAQRYQTALEQLATDWRNHAEPHVLSDDFWNVTHRYDVLLALYNKQADIDF
ncbi:MULTISPECIES: DUF3829 domain-containing protein [Pseudomonas]|uniref:DUF3829 domain-containing protein n=1 Tax=Pseudomonas TaxID=286 RepID=UPI000CD54072|nr:MULTISPECIES: DUF3829 domain-containing protein [Pseudomonas]RBH59152.1 DUF3829 domain-containing protein [Pseudomonas sp. MWU13-2860]